MIFWGHYIKKTPEYTFISNVHGTFSSTEYILGHKANLNKLKSTEIISSIFSDHNTMRLDINHRKRNEKKTDYMETKQYVTKNTNESMRKSKRKLKNILRQMTMKTQLDKNLWDEEKAVLKGSS